MRRIAVVRWSAFGRHPRVAAGGALWGLMLCRSASPTALWCSRDGRAAELAALTAFVTLKQAAASQLLKRACGAPPITLRSSATQNEPPQGTACREAPALVFVARHATRVGAKGCPGVPGRACAAPRSAGRPGRARSALRPLTWEGVSEWHERSECNELPDRPGRTSIAGQSTRSGDRRSGAPRHTRTALCRAEAGMPAKVSNAPQAASFGPDFPCD